MTEGYSSTSNMKAAARRALAWHKDGKRGGTIVGLTRANQIVNGEALSESTIKRMFSFFSRHEVDKKATGFNSGEEGYPSPGRVAWDLWGGDAGFSWSKKLVAQMERNKLKKSSKLGVGDMVTWNSSGGAAKGKITRIIVSGSVKVPKTDFTITGTKENPAAMIRIYKDGKPTDTIVGHKLDALKRSGLKKVVFIEEKIPNDEYKSLTEDQLIKYEQYETLVSDILKKISKGDK
jgi:hypothetical protein